ncbi:MAG TPA: hypothetical protein PL176_05670, partial [Kiritimatiellia bacterium]|nr:hypothetical protein [Kiritimatiellia bacterium]
QAERLHPAASRFRDPFDEHDMSEHVKPLVFTRPLSGRLASVRYDNTGASIRNPGKTALNAFIMSTGRKPP